MEAHVWFVYELVVGSRMFGSIFKMYIAISLECASECVWAYSVCKYLLIVFVTIYGVICSSPVCQGDWLSTCRELLVWLRVQCASVGTDVYVVVEVPVARLGQPMTGTSWVAAKKWGKEYQTFWET